MEPTYFTLDEANALLPYLTKQLAVLKETKGRIALLARELESEGLRFEDLFQKEGLSELQLNYRRKFEELGDTVNDIVFEIQDKGPVVKDIDKGLVDFFAKINGEDGLLCWRAGEAEIQFWHSTTEGFDSRKSLFERSILECVARVH